MTRIVKYNEAHQKIIQLILGRSLVIGDRLPSEREMAVRFGVSQLSIRHAIDMLQSSGILKKRHGSGIFFMGNLEAVKHNSLLGVVNVGDYLYPNADSAYELLQACKRYGASYKLFSVPHDLDPSYQDELLQCDRFIITGFVNKPWLNYLSTLNRPLIQVGYAECENTVSKVLYDWEGALVGVLRQLKGVGLRRIGFLLPDPHRVVIAQAMQRYFLRATQDLGLPLMMEALQFIPYGSRLESVRQYMDTVARSLDALITVHKGSLLPLTMHCMAHGGLPQHLKLAVLQGKQLEFSDMPRLLPDIYNVYFQESCSSKAVDLLYDQPYRLLEEGREFMLPATIEPPSEQRRKAMNSHSKGAKVLTIYK